jgi:hypothetical protein
VVVLCKPKSKLFLVVYQVRHFNALLVLVHKDTPISSRFLGPDYNEGKIIYGSGRVHKKLPCLLVDEGRSQEVFD